MHAGGHRRGGRVRVPRRQAALDRGSGAEQSRVVQDAVWDLIRDRGQEVPEELRTGHRRREETR